VRVTVPEAQAIRDTENHRLRIKALEVTTANLGTRLGALEEAASARAAVAAWLSANRTMVGWVLGTAAVLLGLAVSAQRLGWLSHADYDAEHDTALAYDDGSTRVAWMGKA